MRSPARAWLSLSTLLWLAATPALAYTVVLVDGSKIEAAQKYRLDGDRAIITLASGTETFIDASQIDIAATEQENQVDYGTALVIEGGEVQQLVRDRPVDSGPKSRSLADVIAERRRARQLQGGPASAGQSPPPSPPEVRRTEAGFADLARLPRRPFADPEIEDVLAELFLSQGVDRFEVFQGTRAAVPLVEVRTDNETAVFRALAVAANSLLQLRDAVGDEIPALELLLEAEAGEAAGQFTLTAEDASALVSGEIDEAVFFLRRVEF